MLKRTEGIVLKTTPYSEADLIVTFLTKDLGLRKAFAKSPRKIKSRFGSSLEPLTHSRISLWGKEDANLPRLTQCDIISPFQALRENYDCLMRLSGMMELSLSLLAEGEENREAFNLLKDVLRIMEGDCNFLYAVFYKIRLLELTGLSPELKGCARCGLTGPNFYMSQGSIVCADCAIRLRIAEGALRLTPASIGLYETLRNWEPHKISRVKASEGLLRELSSMLDAHIEYRLSKPLRVR